MFLQATYFHSKIIISKGTYLKESYSSSALSKSIEYFDVINGLSLNTQFDVPFNANTYSVCWSSMSKHVYIIILLLKYNIVHDKVPTP